nr:hypothetical protein [Tanacetum cinerariifolium]
MTKFLDDQRVSNMFVKNNVNDMIIKMKQNEKNFQSEIKNMERKIDEWSKSQNVSLEQTDRTESPPPPQAHTEHVNVVFTGSGKSDDSPKIQTPPPIIVNNKSEKDKPIKTGYHVVKTNEYPFCRSLCFVLEMSNNVTPPDTYSVQALSGGVTKVKKPKKVGSIERLALPKPSKPRSVLKWSQTGRLFDLKGKIIASSDLESQSDCSKGDNACTSNPLKPTIKWFPNSTFSLAGNPNMFMMRRLELFQAYDRESKASHKFRLEVFGNCSLWK